MIGNILGFWLVNWHMIWSCINLSESYINLPVFVIYVCMFIFITYAEVEEAIMR